MNKIASALVAALLPFSLLQACTVGGPDDDVGIAPDEIVEDDDCELGEVRWCEQDVDPGLDGEQTCLEDEAGRGWTACAPVDPCADGSCDQSVGSTPIVLSFTGDAVAYTAGGGDFELTGRGYNVATDWPTARTPWLAFDRDGNGRIDSGAELFGSATRLASGAFAKHGFEALAELDDDGDGAITASDAAFDQLTVWADANADRISQPDELVTLAEAGVVSISVRMSVVPRCDARGNCERERAAFDYVADGERLTGTAIDVHLSWK